MNPRKVINYENIELIKPKNREALIADLEERTGLVINRVEVGRIDYLRDSARVFIYYFESDNWPSEGDNDQPMLDDGDDD